MLTLRSDLRIMVAAWPVDFRRGMDSLAMLVSETLRKDPCSKRSDRIKILTWDGTGLVLYSKRLESGRFTWPPIADGTIMLSAAQLSLLLSGSDWRKMPLRVVDRPLRAG
jgi:transposase